MSMDFERRDPEKPITEQEGVMFAAEPVWERRNRKRGAFGRKATPTAPAPTVAPEPRTFATQRDDEAPMALDTPVDSPLNRPLGHDYVRPQYAPAAASTRQEDADSSLVAPIGRPTARADRGPKSKGIAPMALAAGVVALGAMGAVGWYASRDNDGIPEIAPGQPTTSEMAVAPLPPVDAAPAPQVAETAVNPVLAAAPPPRQTVVREAPVRTAQARTRPAAAPSAGDTAVNSSVTIPAGPQPYSTLNPGATPPAPVNSQVPTITPPAPTEAAPSPAEAPAEIPATPPVEAAPAPETITPPTS